MNLFFLSGAQCYFCKGCGISYVNRAFTWETTYRRHGHVKLSYTGKCPIKCTDLFDVTVVTTIDTYHEWCGRGRDRMVVGFTTTCTISAYHH